MAAVPGLPLLCSGAAPQPREEATAAARDVIQELGVRSFINAAGTFTALTGSLMRPEVVAAMQVASRKYVKLEDLHDAVGKRIAELLHCPAAMVTAGCASALSLATAACVAGKDPRAHPPAARHHRHEERGHRPENAPGRLRPRDPQRGREDDRGRHARGDGKAAISDKTAMMFFLNLADPKGKIHHEEFVAIAR